MASTIKIDTIESRSANAGLTIQGGLNSPTGKPIINKQGQIVGDLILLAMEANTANSVTARLDRISSYQSGNTIMFDSPFYVDYATIRNLNSNANVIASDTTTNNLIATFATLENITANTITANTIDVLGDLFVHGNTVTLDTQTVLIEDNILVIASNNVADIVDLGFAGQYNNGANTLYAGIVRDATDEKFYLFKDYPLEPPTSTLTGFDTSTMTATLFGNFEATTLTSLNSTLENTTANNVTVNTISVVNGTIDNLTTSNVVIENITANTATANLIVLSGGEVSYNTANSELEINNEALALRSYVEEVEATAFINSIIFG